MGSSGEWGVASSIVASSAYDACNGSPVGEAQLVQKAIRLWHRPLVTHCERLLHHLHMVLTAMVSAAATARLTLTLTLTLT